MEIEVDPAKRELTFKCRGLDFLDVPRLFESRSLTVVDDRLDYGEERFMCLPPPSLCATARVAIVDQ